MAHRSAYKSSKIFGKRLAQLRNAASLSQERLAELADIHWRYLQKVEAGVSNPSLDVLCRLKKALACTWDELCGKL